MATTAASLTSSSGSESGLKLKNLTIDDVEDLVFLPKQALHQLQGIDIRDPKLVSTDRLEQVFTTSLSSVPALLFHGCRSLKPISKGLKHLTTLKILVLVNCPELQLLSSIEQPAEDEIGIWEAMKGLHLLLLEDIPKLVVLPTGLQQLTNLQTLLIN
uniref:Uncharacterized protein n=1 Tax=Chenopodium quinoa TaxID=63459 RepID=A0A803L7B1_CHEQI